MSEDIKNISAGEDISLVKDFCNGDNSAFDKLVLKYKDKVFNLCYRFCGNYEDADDCAQEAFIKVYRSLRKFRQESTFSTWLYRIVVNTCKNKLASLSYRQGKIALRMDGPVEKEESSYVHEISDLSLSPRRELERKEKETLIQNAIDSLPADQKFVVVLRDIDGLPYEKIAETTGYTLGTVKSKLARARQKLREKMMGMI